MARRKKRQLSSGNTLLIFLIIFLIYSAKDDIVAFFKNDVIKVSYSQKELPIYIGKDYVIINDNKPNFTEKDLQGLDEQYSELDYLHRAGVAFARISTKTMPNEKRGSIGMIKPSGWHTIKYDNIDGKYLYNRCHLIGFQLTGENANEKNLITCTRQMNTKAMLEFENQVADYVKKTRNQVLYRVTPYYDGENLLANGVQIEAFSVEDEGKGIMFNVYIFNVQDGIEIDYKDGSSYKIE